MRSGYCLNVGSCEVADAKMPIPIPSSADVVACPGGCGNLTVSPTLGGQSMDSPPGGVNFFSWPFRNPDWAASLWMPVVSSICPPLTTFLGNGWAIDAIGRRARGEEHPLPQPGDLGGILMKGLFTYLMFFAYLVIPLIIIAKLVAFNWIVEIVHVGNFVIDNWFRHVEHRDPREFLMGELAKAVTGAQAPAIYAALATPLFIMAQIRYAITGRIGALFNVPRNAFACIRYCPSLLRFMLLSIIMQTCVVIAGAVVATTVVGVLLTFVVWGSGVWMWAYLAGDLALEVCRSERTLAPNARFAQSPALRSGANQS